jgi:hypothetical protein
VAQVAAHRKVQGSKVQQVARPQAPESQPVLAQLVSLPVLPALALPLAEALQARASPPQAPQRGLHPE